MNIKKKLFMAMGTMILGAFLVAAGTMALFTAEVSNTNNTFATGTLTIEDITKGTGASYSFSNIAPGDSDTATFTIKNTGSLAAWIQISNIARNGDLFDGANSIELDFDLEVPVQVEAGGTVTFEVDWSFPLDAGNEYQGKGGDFTVYFQAVQVKNNADADFGN